ncbi:tumor necrosis factor receptor superfamily member 25 isoform X2 [Notolabrus celidotus]|uniref:tumor necrosis factor receptor superfamily member 25 isoform X2 n=1 Tax=Notolabrus celidotus TaxID=1203425 RepID=UPI0014904A71|nr:tumor necrosis factor receptor superfamily member 25 isoform X2 [Notolabrus celidotus]
MYSVILLVLAFLSTGLSPGVLAVEDSGPCYKKCPAGYHKTDTCTDPENSFRCEKCSNGTYTEIENELKKCEKCTVCPHLEVEIQRCLYNNDTKCDCPEGHYFSGNHMFRDCQRCPLTHCEDADHLDCKRKCQRNTAIQITPMVPNTTRPAIATTLETIKGKSPGSSDSTSVKPYLNGWNQIPWILFLVAVVIMTLLVLSWLLLLNRNPLRYPPCCPGWSSNKDLELPVEDPIFNEQRSQVSSPTTLKLKITKGTAQESLLMQNNGQKTSRQEEQSEHWPAIVLYAIIKEVPLRRWKEFLRLLSVADQQLERVELEAGLGLGSIEKQYQMLRLWSQRPFASLSDVFSALHYMELSGCAQLLQESLDNLQFRI